MKYKIISDSCCDYIEQGESIEYVKRVPLSIELDDEYYTDNEEFDYLGFINKMKASGNAPKSACPSIGAWQDEFEGEEKDIYVVTLSAKMSGSFNSAHVAAQDYKESHPEKNIHVFNSKSAAPGQLLLCKKINEAAQLGKKFDEVVEEIENFIDSMKTLFVLESLDVFRKSGRLNHLQSLFVGTLKIKFVMGAEDEGNIGVKAKALTINKCISKLIKMILDNDDNVDYSLRELVITHCNCFERAKQIKDAILEANLFKSITICHTGGISTMYANDGGIILSY